MKYALVKPDGSVERTHEFGAATPPAIATGKGRWVQDVPPAYNPDTHKIVVAEPVPGNASAIPYNIIPLPPARVARIAREKAVLAERDGLKADSFGAAFLAMQPADWNNYVNTNVTDPEARALFRKLGRVVLTLAKREFVND